MNGLKTILSLRRQGLKPSAVFVDLVREMGRFDTEAFALSDKGIVTVNIGPKDSLADVDCRAFVGLHVHVNDYAGNRDRHRRLAAMIAGAEPSRLVMPLDDGTVYVRHAGKGTQTYRLGEA